MRIELEMGGHFWLRVNDYELCVTTEDCTRDERRMRGDPWFKWGSFTGSPRPGEGGCWLGSLRLQWAYPTKARRVRSRG